MSIFGLRARPRSLAFALLSGLALTVAAWGPSPSFSQIAYKTLSGTLLETDLSLTPQPHFAPILRDGHSEMGEIAASPVVEGAALTSLAAFEAHSVFVYVSQPLEAPHPFNALGFRWEGELPDGVRLAIDARTSQDG